MVRWWLYPHVRNERAPVVAPEPCRQHYYHCHVQDTETQWLVSQWRHLLSCLHFYQVRTATSYVRISAVILSLHKFVQRRKIHRHSYFEINNIQNIWRDPRNLVFWGPRSFSIWNNNIFCMHYIIREDYYWRP